MTLNKKYALFAASTAMLGLGTVAATTPASAAPTFSTQAATTGQYNWSLLGSLFGGGDDHRDRDDRRSDDRGWRGGDDNGYRRGDDNGYRGDNRDSRGGDNGFRGDGGYRGDDNRYRGGDNNGYRGGDGGYRGGDD